MILLGQVVGIDGIFGVSILAMLVAVDNSNGGLWLAFTGRYGDKRDRGAYISSALNDGPFFSMLFLGASGLADIPISAMFAAVIPFLLGMLIGNLNPHWREVLRPTPAIVIPFFALSLGTGIDLNNIVKGGLGSRGRRDRRPDHRVLRLPGLPLPAPARLPLGHRVRGRHDCRQCDRDPRDHRAGRPGVRPHVETATAQIAASVLVTAIIAPLLASLALRRAGGLLSEEEIERIDEMDLGIREPQL